jgi:hypothetical protein
MSWKEGGMRRTLGLLAGSLLLAGCSSGVLETRLGPPGSHVAGNRTLVVADVAAPYRAPTEDAIAGMLPGAVAAHTVEGLPDLRGALLAGVGRGADLGSWDTIVLAKVVSTSRSPVELSSHPICGGDPFGNVYVSTPETIEVVLDVSVARLADATEVWGMKIHLFEVTPALWADSAYPLRPADALAPKAATRAARQLVASGLFD